MGGGIGNIGKAALLPLTAPLEASSKLLKAGTDAIGLGAADTPDAITLPSAPTTDDAVAADDASRALARRRGRQSTVLASTDFNQVSTSAKSLLGS